jgi:hypothetical protein
MGLRGTSAISRSFGTSFTEQALFASLTKSTEAKRHGDGRQEITFPRIAQGKCTRSFGNDANGQEEKRSVWWSSWLVHVFLLTSDYIIPCITSVNGLRDFRTAICLFGLLPDENTFPKDYSSSEDKRFVMMPAGMVLSSKKADTSQMQLCRVWRSHAGCCPTSSTSWQPNG